VRGIRRGSDAIEQAKKLKPDLIVLDLAMPRMNGAEAASILSQTMPDVPIVLLTLYQNVLGSAVASAVGIRAVLDKTKGLDKLVVCSFIAWWISRTIPAALTANYALKWVAYCPECDHCSPSD
jgi:CheY-like chemotaxis protein